MMLAASAIVFVVYEQTGSELRAQVEEDVRGTVNHLVQTVRSQRAPNHERRYLQLRRYLTAQPFTDTSSPLLAVIPGHEIASNHAEMFGSANPDHRETAAQQRTRRGSLASCSRDLSGYAPRSCPM